MVKQVEARSIRALAFCDELRRDAVGWKTEDDPAWLEPIDRSIPADGRVAELDVDLEVPPGASGVCIAAGAQGAGVNIGDEHYVRERIAAGGECITRRIALEGPLELSRLTGPPKGPDVVELERVRVDDDESVARLPLDDIVPTLDVSIHPESRRGLRV